MVQCQTCMQGGAQDRALLQALELASSDVLMQPPLSMTQCICVKHQMHNIGEDAHVLMLMLSVTWYLVAD